MAPFIEDALRLSPMELEKKTKSDYGYTFLHALASYTRDRKMLRDQIISVLLAGRVGHDHDPDAVVAHGPCGIVRADMGS